MPSRALNHKRVGKTFPRHRVTRGARTRGSQQQCDRTPERNGGGLWRPPGPPRPTSTLEAPASNRGVGPSRTRAAKAKGTPRGRRPAAPRANASRRPPPTHTHTPERGGRNGAGARDRSRRGLWLPAGSAAGTLPARSRRPPHRGSGDRERQPPHTPGLAARDAPAAGSASGAGSACRPRSTGSGCRAPGAGSAS